MQSSFEKYFETNKETWNKKVAIHTKSEFYNVEGFINGKTSLNSFELNEVGNVKGKRLLHLQCHFGLDTLSWERLGAKCTGIDISNEAINYAKKLARKVNLQSTFIETNLYDVPKNVKDTFDIVFTSYGVLGWLPDLNEWANIVASKLKPNGFLYLIEFHPIAWMFSYIEKPPKLMYHYSKKDVIYEEYKGTYTNANADIVSKEYGWNHGLGEVISALTQAGLEIEFLHEFNESPYNTFPEMVQTKNGLFVLPKSLNYFPLLYSIKAHKK